MSISKIQYIVLQKSEPKSVIEANYNPENRVFEKLRYYPVDFKQFRVDFNYFDYIKFNDQEGLQALILPMSYIVSDVNKMGDFLKLLSLRRQVCVFFISEECAKDVPRFVKELEASEIAIWYFMIYHHTNRVKLDNEPRYFMDHIEFFARIQRDSEKIASYLGRNDKQMRKLKLKIPTEATRLQHFPHFKPLVSNVINVLKAKGQPFVEHQNLWGNAEQEGRQEMLLQSIKELDDLHITWGKNNEVPERWSLPTLILVFPFHHPLIKEVLSSKGDEFMANLVLMEQDERYRFMYNPRFPGDMEGEYEEGMAKFVSENILAIIDGITALHASLTCSPSARFPVKDLELSIDLSLFSLDNEKGILASQNWHDSLLEMGRRISQAYLKPEMEDYLDVRNGQILAVSDLPIEWMLIKGVPLGYLADVCRISDSNLQGYLNNYSSFSKIPLRLGSRTLSKTLVVFSGSAEDIKAFYTSIQTAKFQQEEFGYSVELVNSAEELGKLIAVNRPEMIVFDCHCDFDVALKLCYLTIGRDRIYPDDIITYGIGAPIIYLSCCGSSPNYNTIDKLHDAFFQVGARSVTGTFLPIEMDRASFVYIRMLRLLKSKKERYASGNWLHFLSFALRTSMIWEARTKCFAELGRDLNLAEEGIFIQLLEKIHSFDQRKEVFRTLVKGGIKISDEVQLTLSDTYLEFMYYTHYGRPDLILFYD